MQGQTASNAAQELIDKLSKREAVIGILGMGYVGSLWRFDIPGSGSRFSVSTSTTPRWSA